MSSKVDLHVHSTASDGVHSPSELVRMALNIGLEIMAISDHDSTEGVTSALQSSSGTSLEVWPGIELSTDVPQGEVHVLGYFVDYSDEHFQSVLHAMRQSRRERARRMVMKLSQIGMPVEWQRVLDFAGGGTVGRPHVAEAMREKGYVSSVSEAFDLYIGRNGPAYVERYKLTPEQAVGVIVDSGGLPVLAHPLSGDEHEHGGSLDLEHMIPSLVRAGLVGIETYYDGYDEANIQYLLSVGKEWDLIPTGGSDYHGRDTLGTGLGDVYVPLQAAIDMKRLYQRLRGEKRPSPA